MSKVILFCSFLFLSGCFKSNSPNESNAMYVPEAIQFCSDFFDWSTRDHEKRAEEVYQGELKYFEKCSMAAKKLSAKEQVFLRCYKPTKNKISLNKSFYIDRCLRMGKVWQKL